MKTFSSFGSARRLRWGVGLGVGLGFAALVTMLLMGGSPAQSMARLAGAPASIRAPQGLSRWFRRPSLAAEARTLGSALRYLLDLPPWSEPQINLALPPANQGLISATNALSTASAS